MQSDELPTFEGKTVFVSLVRGNEAVFVLDHVEIHTIGESRFLVGQFAPGLTPGFEGRKVSLRWDFVESIIEFESSKQYIQACRRHGWAQWRSKWASRLNWFYGGD